MTIVSNTSPINNLAKIGQLDLIRQLYGTVIIPHGVYRELTLPEFPVAGANEVQNLDWISVREVSDRSVISTSAKLIGHLEQARRLFYGGSIGQTFIRYFSR